MAQSIKLSVKCDRCEREETRTVEQDIKAIESKRGKPQFTATLVLVAPVGDAKNDGGIGNGIKIEIGDLCTPCLNTVRTHLEAIGKKVEKKSPNRVSK